MTKRHRPSLISLSPPGLRPAASDGSSPSTNSGDPVVDGPGWPPAVGAGAENGPRLLEVRVNGPGWSEMNGLAWELGESVQVLMVEALNDVLMKHGRPPVVEAVLGEASASPAARATEFFSPFFVWSPLADPWWWHRTFTVSLLSAWGGRRDKHK